MSSYGIKTPPQVIYLPHQAVCVEKAASMTQRRFCCSALFKNHRLAKWLLPKMVWDAFFWPVAQILCNVPALLGAMDELLSDFSKPSNPSDFLGSQRWCSPISPCRKRFCMEGQVEMLQSTVRIAEKNATVIQQNFRGHLWRKRLNIMIAATRLIQQFFRAHLACSMPASWQPLDWEGFAFHEVLGQGAFACVQKATADGWMVAVKSPRPELKDGSISRAVHAGVMPAPKGGDCVAGPYPPGILLTYAMRLLRLCISCSGSPSSMAT